MSGLQVPSLSMLSNPLPQVIKQQPVELEVKHQDAPDENVKAPESEKLVIILHSRDVGDARITGTYTGFSHKLDGNTTVYSIPNTGSSSTAARTVYSLAEYRSNSGTQTGAIVFIQSTTASTIMYQLEVEGLQYNPAGITKIIVQGYKASAAASWSVTDKISLGETDVDARWALDPTGKNCLIIGDVGSVWSFPHFSIVRAMFSHTGVTDAICTGWTVAIVTDLTGYTQITGIIANSSIDTSITGSSSTLTTTRTLWGQSFNGSANVSGDMTSVGSITSTGRFLTTLANSTATGGGQIYLNGTGGNRIDFNTTGIAAPSFTTRSVGARMVLFPAIGAASGDYALGIEANTLWQSVPLSTNIFKWYGGTTQLANLSGNGFFVNSIQNGAASNSLFYDSATGEITYQPTSSTPGVLTSVTQSAKIVYTDAANSNAARFIVANGQAVTLTASQKVQVQFVMQFANTASGHNLGATIGRGTTSAVSTSYINLANGVAFSTTDLTITNTIATIENLDTSLSQQWYVNANETATINMNVLDQPGAGTFYYAVRIRSVLSSRFYIRNSYFIITVINS